MSEFWLAISKATKNIKHISRNYTSWCCCCCFQNMTGSWRSNSFGFLQNETIQQPSGVQLMCVLWSVLRYWCHPQLKTLILNLYVSFFIYWVLFWNSLYNKFHCKLSIFAGEISVSNVSSNTITKEVTGRLWAKDLLKGQEKRSKN